MIEVTLFVCIGWIISICFHEFGHAIVAYWGGDTSVKEKGYLTLNPFKYIEPGYSLILPLFFLMIGGIGLPGAAVYIDHQKLRSRWWESAVSAAGPIASILTIIVLAGLFRISTNQVFWLQPALAFLIWVQVWGILINLLPMPSLDGFGIIEPFLSRNLRSRLQPLYRYGFIGLLVLLWFVPPVSNFLQQTVNTITQQALGIPKATMLDGYYLFKRWSLPLLLGMIAVLALGSKFSKTPIATSIEKSEKLLKQQRYAEAITLLNQILKEDPQNFDAWWLKGNTLSKLDCYEEAVDCYQSALGINPNATSLWENSAILLAALHRPLQAIDMYNRALELEPDDPQLWISKAALWEELGDLRRSIATIERAIEVDPRSVDAWYQKAGCQSQLGDHDTAIISLHQAIQLNPTVRQAARTDPKFINLRHSSAFHQLIGDN
jgi:Zn-dependent protease/Tfp pilus assembly protein PilF